MSKIQIQLKLSRRSAVYYSGENFAGIICLLNVSETLSEIKSINVLIGGRVQNYWVNKNSDKIFERSENCLRKLIQLTPSNTSSINMVTGAHNYSFDLDLPENLPSSFDGTYGQISYSIGVEVVNVNDKVETTYEKYERDNKIPDSIPKLLRPMSSYQTCWTRDIYLRGKLSERLQSFTVISSVNLSKYPSTGQPVEAVDTTDYSCCTCLPFGSVRTVITIPKNGFVPNEAIQINAVVYNGTRKKVTNASITLIQRTQFYAKSRYENANDQKETCQNICQLNRGTISPHRFLRIKNESLMIPNVIPTYDSNVISIRYILRFSANPEIEVDIPITIGTETNVEDKNDGLKMLQII